MSCLESNLDRITQSHGTRHGLARLQFGKCLDDSHFLKMIWTDEGNKETCSGMPLFDHLLKDHQEEKKMHTAFSLLQQACITADIWSWKRTGVNMSLSGFGSLVPTS